ncbi:MAG TPA: SAM-dependent methyltransferase, partial [Mycobacteriales bacterium]|nr:SAM-dependent methyltransferase [Mycobacteriales bacterium]
MTEPDPSRSESAAVGQIPSTARVYDALLGGSHNFAVDRQMAEAVRAALPGIEAAARANRAFLRRAVRHLLDLGVEQYLDLGSGLPTVGNVHEIVHRHDPDGRVVYVDIDPVAVAHSRAILRDQPSVTAVRADLRDPRSILAHPDVRRLLHPDRPTGVLAVASLHFVPDSDDPAGIIAAYREALAGGGYLVVSHASDDGLPPEQASRI